MRYALRRLRYTRPTQIFRYQTGWEEHSVWGAFFCTQGNLKENFSFIWRQTLDSAVSIIVRSFCPDEQGREGKGL